MASAEKHECATGAIDPAMAFNFTHEEQCKSKKSAFERFKTTARGLILSIIFRFYQCKRNVSSPWFDPQTNQRVIYGHSKNLREHQEILEDYTDIMLKDGPVQGVVVQPWAAQRMDPSTGTVITHLLSFGTRCDAFHLAKERAPNNPQIMHTEAKGLTDIVVFGSGELQLPPDLEIFLAEEHNRWHGGAGANFITVLVWVRRVEGVRRAEGLDEARSAHIGCRHLREVGMGAHIRVGQMERTLSKSDARLLQEVSFGIQHHRGPPDGQHV